MDTLTDSNSHVHQEIPPIVAGDDSPDTSSIKRSKFQLVLDEIKRRHLVFNGTLLDEELIQEATKQKLPYDKLDRVFDTPWIQLKVRGVLGSYFCDEIGVSHLANTKYNEIPIVQSKAPLEDKRAAINKANQERAFRDCVLKILGLHKSQNNDMNRYALTCLPPGDYTIAQIIAALKKVPGWKGKPSDASWIKARLGTLKPPTITYHMLDTACNRYIELLSTGFAKGGRKFPYKPYFAWRIFLEQGVSLESWFKMPTKKSMDAYSEDYDEACDNVPEEDD